MTEWFGHRRFGVLLLSALIAVVILLTGHVGLSLEKQVPWWQPKATDNLRWQLQLQDDLQLIDGVDVYAVDAHVSQQSIDAAKARGARIMCYISAGSVEDWRDDVTLFPAHVIGKAYDGWPGERWLDIRQLDAIAPIIRRRIDLCQSKGFDVLDADNINGYENDSGFALTRGDAVRYIRWLAVEAHKRGMAFSLKNGESLLSEVADVVDMMQSESCVYYGNCTAVKTLADMNKPVFSVEYNHLLSTEQFNGNACDVARRYRFSMILRDRLLQAASEYRSC